MKATIHTASGIKEVDAYLSATPGLIVHRGIGPDVDRWMITHARSGLAVANVEGSEWAQACAAALDSLVDWTASAHTIRGSINRANFRSVIEEFGEKPTGAVGPEELLQR